MFQLINVPGLSHVVAIMNLTTILGHCHVIWKP